MTHEKKQTVGDQRTAPIVTANSRQILGPGGGRLALVFSCPPTNRYTISFGGAAVLDEGITLYPTDPPLILTANELGSLIDQAIFAISAVADQTIGFLVVTSAT